MGNKKRPLPIAEGGKTAVPPQFTDASQQRPYGVQKLDTPCLITEQPGTAYLYKCAFSLRLRNVASCLLPLLLSPSAGSLCRLELGHSTAVLFSFIAFIVIIAKSFQKVKTRNSITGRKSFLLHFAAAAA